MTNKNVPRIYVVTSKCGKYAWITASSRFESRQLGKNAKVFVTMIHRVAKLFVFQSLDWEMRYHKVRSGTKAEFKAFMERQLTQQGYTVIQ